MIPVFLKQLAYTAKTNSFAAIARATGIPYRTVLRLKNGLGTVIPEYKRVIRNMYQRTAYANLKRAGLSANQANRFSWYRPEVVKVNAHLVEFKVGELATGKVAAKLRKLNLSTTQENVDKYYDDVFEAIKEGMRKSPLQLEDILDY